MELSPSVRTLGITVSLIILTFFSAYVLFYKLGNEPLQDYDEATYAEVTTESIAHGNYASLTFLNQPYFRKPPLLFWLTTTSQRLFSDTEFSVRFPSALSAFLTIILVIGIIFEVSVSFPLALLGGAVLATTGTVMEFARDVRFDNLVTLFIAATFYAGIRALKDNRWFFGVGIFLGLAVLSKSVIAVFGVIAVLIYMLMELGLKRSVLILKNPYLFAGIISFLAVVVPWHLYETMLYGKAFWQSYLGTEVVNRASMNLFPGGSNPTNSQYLGYLSRFAAPWMEVFVVSLPVAVWLYFYGTSRTRSAIVASIGTVFSVLIVMGVAGTKAYGYLIPLYPFMAIDLVLIGASMWQRSNEVGRMATLSAVSFLLLFAAYLTVYNAHHINPYYGYEIGQAQDEYIIGSIIRESHSPTVYTIGYDGLGSILYYSKLPFTENPYVEVLHDSQSVPQNAFLLATSSRAELEKSYSNYTFTPVYLGRFVSLFTVAR